MTVKTPWYECDSRFIAAHYQPAALIDLAISREIDTHRLLRGTGLFYDDILAGEVRISPQQFLVLIDNAQRLLEADDTSFLFGQRLLPGHYGAASQALQQAGNLQQALELLIEMRAVFSPLLAPRILLDEQHAYLYWVDSSGAGPHWRFLIEACMTAVVAMARWLSGQQLPWRFHFAHSEPRYIEQYWVHLGEDLHFDSQLDMLRLPREFMATAWPNAAHTAGAVARQEATRQLHGLGYHASLLDRLYAWLQANVRQSPSLEQAALAFEVSPATFKRKLQKHGTHYQEQHDRVRKHVAFYLYRIKAYSNEEIADFLSFHDAANFRRSFKRWTGLSPSALRQLFEAR